MVKGTAVAWFGAGNAHRLRGGVARAAAVALVAGLVGGVVGPAAAGASARADGDRDDGRPAGATSGFVLADGHYGRFDAPDEGAAMYPSGINDKGEVVGEYMRADGESAFARDARGRITTYDVPGASATEAAKVNDAGAMVGRYSEDTPFVEASARARGFLRQGDELTRIDVPGAVATRPTAVNDDGDVVGTYTDDEGTVHAFLWRDGTVTPLTLRGAKDPTPVDINDAGDIVGQYVDGTGKPQGFLLQDTRYATISAPGAAATIPAGINDDGRIVGYVADGPKLAHPRGVLVTAGGDGPVTSTALPAGAVGLGINDGGDVVGLDQVRGMSSVAGAADAPGMMYTGPMADDVPGPAAAPPAPTDGGSATDAASAAADWDAWAAEGLATVRGITVNATISGNLDALLARAEAEGLNFTGSGYRSHERQIELRRQHCGSSDYAVYEMPSSQCSPPTARPGNSMHERGLAIDFSCDGQLIQSRSSACYQFLAANAAAYGLYNLPSEAWHWSTNGR